MWIITNLATYSGPGGTISTSGPISTPISEEFQSQVNKLFTVPLPLKLFLARFKQTPQSVFAKNIEGFKGNSLNLSPHEALDALGY